MERELLLLGLLRHNQMHGYQLHEFINNNLASCSDLKKPTAYHLLDKMEKYGWLISSADDDSSRPTRKIYQITAEGETNFQRLLRDNLSSYAGATFSNNIGLAFMDALSGEEIRKLLEERRLMLMVELNTMREVPPHSGSMGLIIEHQLHHLESELGWLDSVMTRFANKKEK